jgi:hypothetical protein
LPAVRTAILASHAGSLMFDGVFARSRASAVACASTAARRTGSSSAWSVVTSRMVRTAGGPASEVTAYR